MGVWDDHLNRQNISRMSGDILALQQRLDRIEARQRSYGLHDPDCAERFSRAASFGHGHATKVLPCDCWLSESADTTEP